MIGKALSIIIQKATLLLSSGRYLLREPCLLLLLYGFSQFLSTIPIDQSTRGRIYEPGRRKESTFQKSAKFKIPKFQNSAASPHTIISTSYGVGPSFVSSYSPLQPSLLDDRGSSLVSLSPVLSLLMPWMIVGDLSYYYYYW